MFRAWIDESEFDGKNDSYDNSVMSVREWIVTLVMMLIPVVNVVLLFRWAFASKELTPSNKVNWARATVIVSAMIFLALVLVGGFVLFEWYLLDKSLININ